MGVLAAMQDTGQGPLRWAEVGPVSSLADSYSIRFATLSLAFRPY